MGAAWGWSCTTALGAQCVAGEAQHLLGSRMKPPLRFWVCPGRLGNKARRFCSAIDFLCDPEQLT